MNPPSPLLVNNPHWMYEWEMERSKKWIEHINPICENWMRARGYKIIWPDNVNKPIQVVKL